MNISSAIQQNTYSIRQAIGMANLKKAMNQDAQTVATLIHDMQAINAKIMENSVTPHRGSNIDINI